MAKDLGGFDFEAQPSVGPSHMRDLAHGRWIANGENPLPGVGKMHLATRRPATGARRWFRAPISTAHVGHLSSCGALPRTSAP